MFHDPTSLDLLADKQLLDLLHASVRQMREASMRTEMLIAESERLLNLAAKLDSPVLGFHSPEPDETHIASEESANPEAGA